MYIPAVERDLEFVLDFVLSAMGDMGVNGLTSGNLPDECPGCFLDGLFLKKIIVHMLPYKCPFEQALVHILDTHFSNLR